MADDPGYISLFATLNSLLHEGRYDWLLHPEWIDVFLALTPAEMVALYGSPGGGTVTHASGPLTVSQLVIGNSAADVKVLGTAGTTLQVLTGVTGADPAWDSSPKTTGLTVDTNTLFVDSTNHRVGFGTTAPTSPVTISANPNGALPTPLAGTTLHIGGADATTDRLQFDAFGANGIMSFRRADGILTSPSAVQTDEILGAITFHGYGTAYTSARAQISGNAAEIWSGTNQGTYISFSTTVKGGTGQVARLRITDVGNVGVNLTVPTAQVHIAAGGPNANTGSLKLTNSTLLTAPEAGSIEFVADAYYGTQTTGPTRKQFAMVDAAAVGAAGVMAKIDSTGLTANVAAATLYTVPATGEGFYRVSAYVVETVAGSVSSVLPNVQIIYTDNDSNVSVTIDATPILGAAGLGQTGALNANAGGTVSTGVITIYVKASTTIQYQTVNYASVAAGMTYALRIRLELM